MFWNTNEGQRKLDNSRIQAIGKANPPLQPTQEKTFRIGRIQRPRNSQDLFK
jgi:hypothetical protein